MIAELANAHISGRGDPVLGWAMFGATGVTGKLVLERAVARGHRPTLVGRDRGRLIAAAGPYDLATHVADLDDAEALHAAVKGHRLVLNAAGPYKRTGAPLMRAAMNAGADYVDLNGELSVLEDMFALHDAASARGVALVGGAGFGVAAADGLVAQAVARLGGADWIQIGVAADSAFSSEAVAESTLGVLASGGFEVRHGRLVRRGLAARRWREHLPDGQTLALASAPLAELAAVRRMSNAKHIVAGVPMPVGQAVVLSMIAPLLPALLKMPFVRRQMANAGGHGAGADTRTDHVSRAWVEARLGRQRIRGSLVAGEGFSVAADIAVLAVEEAMKSPLSPGAYSPATAFGPEFISRVASVGISFGSP